MGFGLGETQLYENTSLDVSQMRRYEPLTTYHVSEPLASSPLCQSHATQSGIYVAFGDYSGV